VARTSNARTRTSSPRWGEPLRNRSAARDGTVARDGPHVDEPTSGDTPVKKDTVGGRLEVIRSQWKDLLLLLAAVIAVLAFRDGWLAWAILTLVAGCRIGAIATHWPPKTPMRVRWRVVALVLAAGIVAGWELRGGFDEPAKSGGGPSLGQVVLAALRTTNAAIAASLAEAERRAGTPRPSESAPAPAAPNVLPPAVAPSVRVKVKLHASKGGVAMATVELETGGSKSPGAAGSNLALTEKASTAKAPMPTLKSPAASVPSNATDGSGGASTLPSAETGTGGTPAPEEPSTPATPAPPAPAAPEASAEQSKPSPSAAPATTEEPPTPAAPATPAVR
jgi:hypothetical protein